MQTFLCHDCCVVCGDSSTDITSDHDGHMAAVVESILCFSRRFSEHTFRPVDYNIL